MLNNKWGVSQRAGAPQLLNFVSRDAAGVPTYKLATQRDATSTYLAEETGQTNPIERLNNTFRQRISRLVRESLSFSKKMENHVGEPFGI